ncbi:hypothetical protein EUTSA_v10024148mg [Eutrema salsugineum]|uniref:NAC domain-containing protein n=1 Tax=Eutrema salsugineum TaxID=72664 RepID=V4KEC9_EUTSA|nr:protein CUP-SHAPED COTYLEDON 1 [Eutrema salsugineum]ESQ29484.1 hypothetical protein EUTSA_v10024148mg [Eutrema salsugineum]
MEDHSISTEDDDDQIEPEEEEGMEEIQYYLSSSDDDEERIPATDERMISHHLNMMINESWPHEYVYNLNPWTTFNNTPNPNYMVFVKPRTEASGRTDDGCGAGCWRIIGRDKLIKSEETGKILGFKRILKFCDKEMRRSEERIWVMEEFRLADKRKQDQVMCTIQLLLLPAVSALLAKHFSFLPK